MAAQLSHDRLDFPGRHPRTYISARVATKALRTLGGETAGVILGNPQLKHWGRGCGHISLRDSPARSCVRSPSDAPALAIGGPGGVVDRHQSAGLASARGERIGISSRLSGSGGMRSVNTFAGRRPLPMLFCHRILWFNDPCGSWGSATTA